ncbi:Protein of unknown function, partial [Gryllus bimaculatus]
MMPGLRTGCRDGKGVAQGAVHALTERITEGVAETVNEGLADSLLEGEAHGMQLDLMMFDSNNWKPDATQSSYALSLPVPVPAGTFLLDVPGFDYDMTGRGVEVSVEVDNAQYQGLFSARASAVVNRGFTVTLSSAMEIRVKEPVAFTLRIK